MSTVATLGPFEHHVCPNGDEVFYRDSDHSYWSQIHMPNGHWCGIQDKRLLGVTTAIKALDFDPEYLMRWVAELTRDGKDWERERNQRAKSGTLVHKQALHALATGRPVPDFKGMTDEEHGLARAVLAFWHEWEPVTELSEQIVYSKTHGIAGRPDWIGLIQRNRRGTRRVLLDAKTKANGASRFIPVKHHGQLAMYDLLAEECEVGRTDEQWILMLRPDGTYEIVVGQATHEDALAALQVYRAAQRIGKAMKAQRA